MSKLLQRSLSCLLHFRLLLACGLLVFSMQVFYTQPAFAQTSSGGNQSANANNCGKYKGLINRFGSCIKDTVMKTGKKYFASFYAFFLTALSSTLTLAVALYGVLIVAGMVENVSRDTMILALKITFVIFFSQNLEFIYNGLIQMMDGLIDLFFQFSTSLDEGKCSQVSAGFGPFSRLDCLMDLVIGIKTSTYDGSFTQKLSGDGISRGLINFFYKSGISGSLGLFIGGIGFFIVYTLIFTVIRVVFLYLMAVISITFMVIIGPMFIPLVLFKVTRQYFDHWVGLLVSFTLQPVIMFAYVACMIIAFDKAIFSGSNSLVGTIAGPSAQPNNFSLNQYLDDSKAVKRDGFGIEAKVDDSLKKSENLLPADKNNAIGGMVMRDQSQTSSSGKGPSQNGKVMAQNLPLNQIDWKKLAEAQGIQEKDLMKKMMTSIIFVALVAYVFFGMLKNIPSISFDLAGSESTNLTQALGANPLAGAGQDIASALKGGVERLLGRGGGR